MILRICSERRNSEQLQSGYEWEDAGTGRTKPAGNINMEDKESYVWSYTG